MACKTKVTQIVKLNVAAGTATPVGDPFLFDGTPYTDLIVECPEAQIIASSVCTEDPADPTLCLEGVKCLIEVATSCPDGIVTNTVLGYVHNGTSYAPGDLTEIPCPVYQVTTTDTCPAVG